MKKEQSASEVVDSAGNKSVVVHETVISASPAITVADFIGVWNNLAPHFENGIRLDNSRAKLVRAVLDQLKLLKEV